MTATKIKARLEELRKLAGDPEECHQSAYHYANCKNGKQGSTNFTEWQRSYDGFYDSLVNNRINSRPILEALERTIDELSQHCYCDGLIDEKCDPCCTISDAARILGVDKMEERE